MGPAEDAVALALAYGHACRGASDLWAFASDAAPRPDPVSFGPTDLRAVPAASRPEGLSRRERRWVPDPTVTDRVVLSEPVEPVDLPTVRARSEPSVDTVARCSGQLRPGGHLLVLDPSPLGTETLPGFVAWSGGDGPYRLYRKNRRPGRRTGDRPPGPAGAAADRSTLSDRSAQDDLVLTHLRLAQSLARRFAHHGEPADDLEQVALLALVKASRRFDPSLNFTFATFATSSIQGELKRHFRDKTWSMRVPRAVQEMYLAVKAARDELSHQLRATPSVSQIAGHLGATEDAVLEAMEAGDAYWPDSLNAGYTDDEPGMDIPVTDGGYDRALELHELKALLPRLDDRERLVVARVYIDRCTQRAVAHELGISQMQVSRILSGAIGKLRRWARER